MTTIMLKRVLCLIVCTGLMSGCASYKQNIMFKLDENSTANKLKPNILQAERNYLIRKNDYIVVEIFSNNGEKLIDPNPELSQTQGGAGNSKSENQYLVDLNGMAKFPLIGEVKVEGYSLREAELLLQKEFEKFFKSPYVTLQFNNKRVIILGAPGGQVLPLKNENTTLAEVLAMAKGVGNDAKAQNIRVLRGENVFLADFSTIEGFQKSNMIIEPGDIVYIEPIRKPLAEGFRDYSILLTLVVTLTTLVTLFTR